MNKLLLCVLALISMADFAAEGADGIYARMKSETSAILSNGGQLKIKKGDFFPFVGYDGTQALMELKFGSLFFWTWKENAEIVPERETAEAITRYTSENPDARSNPPNTEGPINDVPSVRATLDPQSKTAALKAGNVRPADIFPVDASSAAWQNSGIFVKAGQHVLVQANPEDSWDIGLGITDAKGYRKTNQEGTPLYHTGMVNEDWHWGALVCAIGSRNDIKDSKNQVEIGMRKEFDVDSAGYLYLICNDAADDTRGYTDNSGIVHVKITVTDQKNDVAENHAHQAAPSVTPSSETKPAGKESVDAN